MRGVRKKAGVALVATALMCGAAACSSDDDGKAEGGKKPAADAPKEQSPRLEPAAAVRKAAETSEKLTSFSYRAKGTVPGEGKVSMDAAMSIDPLAVGMKATTTTDGVPETGEIRLIGNAVYMGSGKPDPELDNKSWIKIAMDDKDLQGEQNDITSQAEKNPAAESAFLAGSKDVEFVGTETVDGVQTRHYRGTVTLDQMRAGVDSKNAKTRESREKSLKEYESMGIKTLNMDMWVDEDDRTKQFRMRAAAKKGPMDMTLTFLDFNKPVEVKAPPASETFHFAAEMEKMAGE